jgi:hypothetical protein
MAKKKEVDDRSRVAISLSEEEHELLKKLAEKEQRSVAGLAKLLVMKAVAEATK